MRKVWVGGFWLLIACLFFPQPVSAVPPCIPDRFCNNDRECEAKLRPGATCSITCVVSGWRLRSCLAPPGTVGCGDPCYEDSECGLDPSCPICDPTLRVCVTTVLTGKGTDPCFDYNTREVNLGCQECLGGDKTAEDLDRPRLSTHSWTAAGCIPVEPAGFVSFILRLATGIAGGIAFLIMATGSVKILTSQGNPEGIQSGKDMITSAIAGLLFIAFSVIILQIIGYDILRIPGITK